jgi:hypothetical protein
MSDFAPPLPDSQKYSGAQHPVSPKYQHGKSVIPPTKSVNPDENPTFISLFSGKMDIHGGDLGFRKAMEWLQEGSNTLAKIIACIVVSEKPTALLATGKTKTKKGDGVAANEELMNFLPKLSTEEKDQMLNSDKEAYRMYEKSRRTWGAFADINVSMVRRVAYMALEHVDSTRSKIINQWFLKWRVRPHDIVDTNPVFVGCTKETVEIRMAQLRKHNLGAAYWSSQEVVAFFTKI